uniref:Uncharacterized protein n=1 Tax=Rhizophora mucronata TaxID=61149 RepID=A0A2P2NNY2_RHIMU
MVLQAVASTPRGISAGWVYFKNDMPLSLKEKPSFYNCSFRLVVIPVLHMLSPAQYLGLETWNH